ncbi:MAG: sterol-binding protein [Actinobacteria bacterium]|nr:MAG: sterol-binding protein [Actinomycetota bacterium]
MTSPTTELFTSIGRRGYESLLEKVSGTLRFDLENGHEVEHWHLVINKGDVRVTQTEDPAECVIHADHDFFDKLATGEENTLTALLRNQITVEGDSRLLMLFGRLLPGRANARHPRPATRGRWRRD